MKYGIVEFKNRLYVLVISDMGTWYKGGWEVSPTGRASAECYLDALKQGIKV